MVSPSWKGDSLCLPRPALFNPKASKAALIGVRDDRDQASLGKRIGNGLNSLRPLAAAKQKLLRGRLRACPRREGVVASTALRHQPWTRVGHSCLCSTTVLRRIRAVVSDPACGGELERHDVVAAPPIKPSPQPAVHAVEIGVT